MIDKTPLINILTYSLPYKLANQLYNEYQSRLTEAKYIIDISDRYKRLSKHLDVVEILLALTIFHKRVIANLDAAVKFHGTVNSYGDTDTIKIGSYHFTGEEKNKILGLTINYDKLREKYGILPSLNDYELTKDFLVKVLYMLNDFEYGEERNRRTGNEEDNIPF